MEKTPDMLPKEYGRSALKEGLRQEEKLGVEAYYNVVQPDDVAHAEWSARFFLVPVLLAPGSNLAKSLNK